MRKIILNALLATVATAFVVLTSSAQTSGGGSEEGVDSREAQMSPGAVIAAAGAKAEGESKDKPEFPKWEDVAKDYTKVVSTADGAASLYGLWTREKDGQVLAELPRNFESQKLFIAFTVAGGTTTAGVQSGDMYAYWKRYDKNLALIQPNYGVRTTGDLESQKGRERVFTDRVLVDVPIVTMGPGGGPVLDVDALLLGTSHTSFRYPGANPKLATIAKAKAFPKNVEVAFELPLTGGQLGTLHYSISEIPASTGYTARVADERVGFFTTTHQDIGHPGKDTPWIRHVNRWKLEKADPKLKLSPPKEPIVFYLEHTTPVRYRRWVREGVLEWNMAFEKCGIVNAIEVYQQDARTGAHMDKDPEDARYNFVLWTNANMGFAIGPSRVDPRTGQILDADIVMDEGFITSWVTAYKKMIPEAAMRNFSPQTLAWLESRPQWDPRVRLALPSQRADVARELARERAENGAHTGRAGHLADSSILGDEPFDGLSGRMSQVNGYCDYASTAALELALFRLAPEVMEEIAAGAVARPGGGDGSSAAAPDEKDPVTGTWQGLAEVPEMGQLPFELRLEMADGGSVSGELLGDVYRGALSGQFDDVTRGLTMKAEVGEGVVIDFNLTVGDDSLTGTASATGQIVSVSATRTSRERPGSGGAESETGSGDAGDAKAEAKPEEKGEAEGDEAKDEKKEDEKKEEEKPEGATVKDGEQLLDGIPESFLGPLLKGVIMHEVGHTLGLRHNFKASTIYDLAEINCEAHRGRAITGSVMDYNPVNVNFEDGEAQGEYAMVTIGPYDYWAIEYGYTLDSNLEPILDRVSEPELIYGTDEDSWGSDPRARVFDMGKDPLDYCDSTMRLVRRLRGEILERMVKDGESWAKAREAYELLLGRHFNAVSIAANWIGGTYSNRDKKGDPGDRDPVTVVEADQQQRALEFVIANAFDDDAYGLTPELLAKMSIDKWWDEGGFNDIFEDPAWPVHDRILGLQAAALTMLMNPTTLNQVYDNEFRLPEAEDALTVPDVIFGVTDAVWSELDEAGTKKYSARKPLISSLRRNLQREHLDRLIDLTMPNARFGAAEKTVANLSTFKLRELDGKIGSMLENKSRLDPYTLAHVSEAKVRIDKALDAEYIYNVDKMSSGSGLPFFIFGEEFREQFQPFGGGGSGSRGE